MRLNDKHLVSIVNKETFHLNFQHFMELEGKCNTMEVIEELGIAREEVVLIKKKMSRT